MYNPYGDYDASLPKTKHADPQIEAGLFARDAPLPALMGQKPLHIVGDKGAIEATIKEMYKKNLGKSNEPALEPVFVREIPGITNDGKYKTLRKEYDGAPDTLIIFKRESTPPYDYIRHPAK